MNKKLLNLYLHQKQYDKIGDNFIIEEIVKALDDKQYYIKRYFGIMYEKESFAKTLAIHNFKFLNILPYEEETWSYSEQLHDILIFTDHIRQILEYLYKKYEKNKVYQTADKSIKFAFCKIENDRIMAFKKVM